MEYFYFLNNNQCGPVDESRLLESGVRPETLVWREGMPQWEQAQHVAELAHLFEQPLEQAMPQQQNMMQQASQQPQGAPQFQFRPESNLILAILSTLLCCLPLGLVAIIQASKVNTLFDSGQVDAAFKASKEARKWSIYACVAGIVFWVLAMIFTPTEQ